VINKGKLGETYFVGPDGVHVNNLETIKKILNIMGLSEDRIEFVTDRPGHDAKYALDTTKIKTELGWAPKFSVNETLKQTVQWYTDNQDWWKKIKESDEYKNYYNKQYGKK
jgi:dTDP-glucose 4,6-dehydratase